jgi:prepilin-type N-terminal cleavage/methylation domain-containing protein
MTTIRSLRSHDPHHPPRGFSIIELLVTLVLLAIALLALSGTATAIARLEAGSARAEFAAAAVESRFEILRSTRCVPASGSDAARGVAERWVVVPAVSNNIREIADTIRISSAPSRSVPSHTEVFRSKAPC